MGGIFREQEGADQASNGLGFVRPKRAAAAPSKAAGGSTAKEADAGAVREPPVLTFEPPRRRVALPARGGKGGTAMASSPRVPGAQRRTLNDPEPAPSGLKQRLTAWLVDS